MTVELNEDQVRAIIWLMDDRVSAVVMAMPQFQCMRDARETMQQALTAFETEVKRVLVRASGDR